MAKVTITLTDHATEEHIVETDQTIKIEMLGTTVPGAADSPAILVGLAIRRLLDNNQFVSHSFGAVTADPEAFWAQFKEVTGLSTVAETPNVNG